ncbi:kinase-like protein [Aspergillus aurantiobrunneus]
MPDETVTPATGLPTIAEIEAATDVLSMLDNSAKVVRVKEHFAVKFGNGIPLSEAENIKFLAANSRDPVPKVYAAFKLLPSLTVAQKSTICKLVRDEFTDLRNIPPQDYLGTLNRQPYLDGYARFLQKMIDSTLHGHRTVFTHGDLQPKNIIVKEVDQSPHFKITLIGWAIAGWYPEYWDFCNATIACRFKPDWLELASKILDEYPVEYLMMQVVYGTVFY